MHKKLIDVLENANYHSCIDFLESLEKDGWEFINPDLEKQEILAREWENKEFIHHQSFEECDWCDQQKEAWESIHGRSAAE